MTRAAVFATMPQGQVDEERVETGFEPEESFFVESDDARLLAHLHRPPPAGATRLGVVTCAPFGDEQLATHRMLRDIGIALAARGIAVLRFDPRGLGDSEGCLEEATPARAAADVLRVCDTLRERQGVSDVGLVGVRLGTLLAARCAQETPMAFLACLAPLVSAQRAFQVLLRRQVLSDVMYGIEHENLKGRLAALECGQTLDVGGYPLSPAFYRGYAEATLDALLAKLELPLWLGFPATAGSDVEVLREAGRCAEVIESDDLPFWEFPAEGSVTRHPRALTNAMVDWIAGLARAGTEKP